MESVALEVIVFAADSAAGTEEYDDDQDHSCEV